MSRTFIGEAEKYRGLLEKYAARMDGLSYLPVNFQKLDTVQKSVLKNAVTNEMRELREQLPAPTGQTSDE